MSEDLQVCPNCKAALKKKLIGGNSIIPKNDNALINFFNPNDKRTYCSKCSPGVAKYTQRLKTEKESLSRKRFQLSNKMPIVSINNPIDWKYKVIGIATAQSTTGTGVITEVTSSITDLMGAKSGRHNKKIIQGEDICFAQLRSKALDLGGNAVIGTDIDYAEIGSGKGILMICMAGTIINVSNTDVFPKSYCDALSSIKVIEKRQAELKEIISSQEFLV